MRQLLLDLGAQAPQTLDSFVPGENSELLQLLRRMAARSGSDHFAYLWGAAASGKSHLLHALAQTGSARYIAADADMASFIWSPEIDLYLLDDCEQLSPGAQVAAFTLFNLVRDNGAYLVAAGNDSPSGLRLRDDLRSRIAWGLAYQLHRLTDEEKLTALTQMAQARGLILSPAVLPYLITHCARDMRSLAAMLEALDRYSLETRRPITLPLLRERMQLDAMNE
ncbi:MAG: DnaA regulatory inactivator Hda [Burkholderiaceae bacterium]|nr:DnaA regulatory inactivator Hda [Burkholderiaceae bacterium]